MTSQELLHEKISNITNNIITQKNQTIEYWIMKFMAERNLDIYDLMKNGKHFLRQGQLDRFEYKDELVVQVEIKIGNETVSLEVAHYEPNQKSDRE